MTNTIPFDEFVSFRKIPRLNRDIIVTEKIDGTNACISIDPTGTQMRVGSRNRWITPDNDNFGFAKWAEQNRLELLKLGPGRHYGEWWGSGIQRSYGLTEKRFSLFNVNRWIDRWLGDSGRPECCDIVPVMYRGVFDQSSIDDCLAGLLKFGSVAVPGFMRPEGVVVYHVAAGHSYKVLLENDNRPKGQVIAHA